MRTVRRGEAKVARYHEVGLVVPDYRLSDEILGQMISKS